MPCGGVPLLGATHVFAMILDDSVLWISLVPVSTLAALAQQHMEIAASPWSNVMNITFFNCCIVAACKNDLFQCLHAGRGSVMQVFLQKIIILICVCASSL